MQIGRQPGEQSHLGLLRAHFQIPLLFSRLTIHRCLQDEPHVVQHDPWCLDPGRHVGVEIHLAMTVIAQETLQTGMEFWKP